VGDFEMALLFLFGIYSNADFSFGHIKASGKWSRKFPQKDETMFDSFHLLIFLILGSFFLSNPVTVSRVYLDASGSSKLPFMCPVTSGTQSSPKKVN
jgi:hypothetical protein